MSLTVEKCLQAWTNSLRQMHAKADIVFFGDSLTYYGDFSSVFPDKVVCNLGLRGDTIEGMINRVEQLRILRPNIVYLMAGINDLEKYNLGDFSYMYYCLVNCIQEVINGGKVVLQSILPVNNIEFKISCTNLHIVACNEVIKNIAIKKDCFFLDVYSSYEKEGVLLNEYTTDGIHLKNDSYNCWRNILKDCQINIE